MTPRRRRTATLLALLSGLGAFARPSIGAACMNGTLIETDEMIRRLRVAEAQIEAGAWAKARRASILKDSEILIDERVDRRRTLLLAVVHLRMGRTKAAERTFRAFLRRQKDDPRLLAWLAESLEGRRGFDAVEAWQILDDLERRDLIPEAEAWAALARLRQRDHDAPGRDRAVERCRIMARDRATCPVFGSLASR